METSCGLVLVNDGMVLLLQYPQGHWGLPKGHVEPDDASHEWTALRELKEETGIDDVELVPGFAERTEYEYTHKGIKRRKEVHWFLGRTDEMEVRLSHEHRLHLWTDWASAQSMVTFDAVWSVLRRAEDHLTSFPTIEHFLEHHRDHSREACPPLLLDLGTHNDSVPPRPSVV